MRAFVALELPSGVRSVIADSVRAIRDRLPAARWVRRENLHLTIRFLGEVEDSRIPELDEKLQRAFAGVAPMTLQLVDAGTYPPGRPARVVWIGLSDPSSLDCLARAVASATVEFTSEIAAPRAKFSPHVTVARCRKPWPRSAVAAWVSSLGGPVGKPFRLEQGVLMSSRLTPGGARYSVEGVYRFGEA